MTTQMNVHLPDFDKLVQALVPTDEDWIILANIVVEAMIRRIKDEGITKDGRPLSQNSAWWTAQKLREGKLTGPLQYTGGLSRKETYELHISEEGVYIQLRADYTKIHLDLIEISERTGKNYKDWFGLSKEDRRKVMRKAEQLLHEKINKVVL